MRNYTRLINASNTTFYSIIKFQNMVIENITILHSTQHQRHRDKGKLKRIDRRVSGYGGCGKWIKETYTG